jgi:hypothetical protein
MSSAIPARATDSWPSANSLSRLLAVLEGVVVGLAQVLGGDLAERCSLSCFTTREAFLGSFSGAYAHVELRPHAVRMSITSIEWWSHHRAARTR